MTVRDLIYGSMKLIGAIASGETPAANEVSDGVTVLSDMLDSWSVEGLMVPAIVIEKFNLIVNQQTYTLGPSGDFNTSRPVRIIRAGIEVQSSNNFEVPIEIVNVDQWAEIVQKSAQSTIPQQLYIQDTNPLMTLNFYQIPTVANKVVLYSEKSLLSITDANTSISFPPGYNEALRSSLAIRLAPEYGKPITPELADFARESKANVARINSKPVLLETDVALVRGGGAFNWLTGE